MSVSAPAPGPGPATALSRSAATAGSPILARFAQELRRLGTAGQDPLRLIELQRLLLELPEGDLPEALRLIEQTPKEMGTGQLVHALFARWAEFGVEKALIAARDLDLEKRLSAQTGTRFSQSSPSATP